MLPTTGYFKNIDCPYFDSSCDRPYCHFKHRRKNPESAEGPPAAKTSTEVPTYNPTPKSQLVGARSHIPISYVPDLAVRRERNHFRSVSYGFGDKQPTYNPTPLSILSTGKANSSKSNDDKEPVASFHSDEVCTPLYNPENVDELSLDGLETEFDMIDELINDSSAVVHEDGNINDSGEVAAEGKVAPVEEKQKSKSRQHSKDEKKHNGKIESKSSRSKSGSKSSSRSGSHSSKKDTNKSETKHKKEHSSSKSRDKSKKEDGKSGKGDDKSKKDKNKCDSKEKHSSRQKEASKEKDRHKNKPKERDKGKDKHSSKEKKHRSNVKESSNKDSSKNVKVTVDKIKSNAGDLFQNCDMSDGEENCIDYPDSDFEEDPLAECYKIFTEYKPTEPEIFPDIPKQEPVILEEATPLFGKKRIAHDNIEKHTPKVMFNKPKGGPSAAQTMVNRYKMARLAQASNEQNDIMAEISRMKRPAEPIVDNNKKPPKLTKTTKAAPDNKPAKPSTSTSLIDDIISGKPVNTKPRRIAPVQNVNSIQRAKAKIEEMAKMKAVNAIIKTGSQTAKSQKRVAHVPEFSVADVPEVLEAERSKLPVNVRNRYLTMIVEECMKMYLSKEEAQQRAINEEYKCYERCAALVTYRNSSMLAINRLRKEFQEREMSGLGPILPGEIANSNKGGTCELKGAKFYENIKRFILSEDELVLHGYPREGPIPGRAVMKQRQVVSVHLEENDRICSRCSKHYRVDDEGFSLYEEECLYHPLKKRTFRGESIYLCCKSGEGAGCVTSPTHVCDRAQSAETEAEGFQTTMPPEREDDPRSIEVFALDCEMCYTTRGLELTRVTIVNAECKTVYETLVKPLNPIIDYNTRFSGITPEQMNRTATSILQVQANILHLCNSDTILIGHSLESDMKALKIIHSTVIDTSVLFPHKFGLPHKRALRDLAREFLKKIIQNDISGHDSAEDALTCMELVQWKVKEEFKGRGVKI